jgi:hypothetical protein
MGDFKTPTQYPNVGDYKGQTGLSPHAAYPSTGALSYPKVPVYPSTTPVYKETTHIPPRLRPYGSTSKNMGKLKGMMNHHLNPSSTSTHTSHMND